jgi:hypothetical protein
VRVGTGVAEYSTYYCYFTQYLRSSERVLNGLWSCRGSKLEVLSYRATTEAPGILRIRFGLDILNAFSVAGMERSS